LYGASFFFVDAVPGEREVRERGGGGGGCDKIREREKRRKRKRWFERRGGEGGDGETNDGKRERKGERQRAPAVQQLQMAVDSHPTITSKSRDRSSAVHEG
jgi:hypothetical protein